MRSVVTLVAVLALAPQRAEACDELIIEAKVVEFAARGGILVRFHASPTKGTPYELPLVNKKWKFKLANQRTVKPKVALIAPGLVVYRLPPGAKAGVLVEGEKRIAELDALGDDIPALDAPKVRSISHAVTGGKSPHAETTVEVIGGVPRDAIAIVLADTDGNPMTFGMVEPNKPAIAFQTRDCMVLPEGTVEPAVGMRVKAFWVDRWGRVSPRSIVKKIIQEPSKEP